MFSDVVMEVDKEHFEELLAKKRDARGVKLDSELTGDDLKELVNEYKQEYLRLKGEAFPQNPEEQLIEAVTAVFRSWDNPRAHTYRRLNHIPYEWGTAVNVQSMVFW